ncbi:MAG TPA: hypothetical protein VGM44_18535 [Polyangiaceae bacterium]|jgi:hypothetical protein
MSTDRPSQPSPSPASLRPLAQAELRPSLAPIHRYTTAAGMNVALYALPLEAFPADFFADPDGSWTFESLQTAAGFSALDGVAIGALRCAFNGHPDGAAVVTLNAAARPYVAIVECPIAYAAVEDADNTSCSAA